MVIKFFRKNNALSIQNATTRNPTNDELIEELIKKLAEKAHQIEVIYTKSLRDEYLKKKNKLEESLKLSEQKVKVLLAERLAIDLFQLFVDISRFYNIEIASKTTPETKTEMQIKEELQSLLKPLKTSENTCDSLQEFYALFVDYCLIYDLNIEQIKSKQKQVEFDEGSFFEGLFVVFEQ